MITLFEDSDMEGIMKLNIVVLIIGSIIFLIAFLKGIFIIIKKPQAIINKKLRKTEKLYEMINANEYLSNLGKLFIYCPLYRFDSCILC